jgi:tRNA (guanine-N7-)-methyltransferase
MRVRNIPGVGVLLKESHYFLAEARQYRGGWENLFKNTNPIHAEIGMGKGQFVAALAEANPDISYIGIEKSEELVYKALQRIKDKRLQNVFLICEDANNLKEVFGEGELDRIYLNFSDPWVKARHSKRRLTHRRFLDIYSLVIRKGGELRFRTDCQMLFEFTLDEMKAAGLKLLEVSNDLHKEPKEGHIMTEYEEKFVQMGKSIYQCIAEIRQL